jgi:ketosteroid isomerase-like protein
MNQAEVVRQMLDAFYSSGLEGARAFYDPEIRWISRFPRERVLRGPEEVAHGLDELQASGRTIVPITRDVVDRGPCVVVPGEMQIRERGSVRQTQVWWVMRVRSGKVLWGEDCLSRTQLDAAVARAEAEGQDASGVSSSD